jgi:hypothetical protein
LDTEKKFGFVVKGRRFKVIEDEEVEDVGATAIVETYKDFFIEFLESDDWVMKAVEGYNTYKVNVRSSDGRDYVHYRNLMAILKWLYGLVE